MLASLIEGTFGRLFRSEVRPMELARKLTREMDEHRTTSVSRVYAPNEYAVWLSPADRARYEDVEHELIAELSTYLLEHARQEQLTLLSPPAIVFHTDADLALGEFGIEARVVRLDADAEPAGQHGVASAEREAESSPAADAPSPAAGGRGQTMIWSASRRLREPLEQAREGGAGVPQRALLLVEGRRLLVAPNGAVIGRSRDCDIVLDDAGVSRRHARLAPSADSWTIEDLESTNGVRVNDGHIQGAHRLRRGDRIEVGSTEIVFELR